MRFAHLVPLMWVLTGCGEAPRDLNELTVMDSVYVDEVTGSQWTGPVYRDFEEVEGTELEGALVQGAWHGDLTVYHPNGRIRYMGSFYQGERCGAWTENTDSVDLGSVYQALIREMETMALYPPCDGSS